MKESTNAFDAAYAEVQAQPQPQPQPQPDCAALAAGVRQVRDRLAHQERQLAERGAMLDRYPSGAATPTNPADVALSPCGGPVTEHEG